MITIRDYITKDAVEVGRLIARTYSEFNLSSVTPEVRLSMLGPFRYAWSAEKAHQAAVAKILESPIFFVAEVDGLIVGLLRGRKERLASLFVHKDYHHQGVGRRLVEKFEVESISSGVEVIRLASTLYAIPFYSKLGYKKSTGVRTGWSFDGYGFQYQPMKKVLVRPAGGDSNFPGI